MSFDSLMNTTVSVQAPTKSQNDKGEVTVTWAQQFVMPCRKRPIQSAGGSLRESITEPAGDFLVSDFVFYAPPQYVVKDEYRLVENGVIFEIVKVRKDSSNHHWEIEAKYAKG